MILFKNIRVAVIGAEGRMGSMLIKFIAQNKKVFLGAALVRKGSNIVGIDVGKLIGINPINIMVTDDLVNVLNDFDILIDFTTPKSTQSSLLICKKYKKSMIIGTTGFNEIDKKIIKETSKEIPIVLSENFSISMNVIYKLLAITAKLIGEYSDIKIIESHHKKKIDTPSGTALKIREIIDKNIKKTFQSSVIDIQKVFSNDKRKKQINICSIRIEDVIGEHKVVFSTINEQVEINHKVLDRIIFVHGVVKACLWLKEKKAGLYSMEDVLNI
ncbi:4-hydroxy-tetrahydrodipicolinate reductase [Arsenophonus symbiont of Ornithomya chloropus]|uniref:4-hydroxy-tetrahydrodipicolinate reductase n=1 Tax=Arsenophonus symbiont of Ornithomya chloropus TaxID=634121 RepID=UPI0032B2E652